MLTLYTTPLSANGRKALAVCRHLGIEAEIKIVDVYKGQGHAPEYLSINPWGKIPALVDGDFTLWESNAILQYLSEAHGDCRLWSKDPRRRADISRWMFWESSHWQPALIAVLAPFVGQLLLSPQAAAPTSTDVRWNDERLQPLLTFLDQHLRRRPFLCGDELTLADFSVGAMMMYTRPAGFPFSLYAGIGAWYACIESTAAWKETAAGPWKY